MENLSSTRFRDLKVGDVIWKLPGKQGRPVKIFKVTGETWKISPDSGVYREVLNLKNDTLTLFRLPLEYLERTWSWCPGQADSRYIVDRGEVERELVRYMSDRRRSEKSVMEALGDYLELIKGGT